MKKIKVAGELILLGAYSPLLLAFQFRENQLMVGWLGRVDKVEGVWCGVNLHSVGWD